MAHPLGSRTTRRAAARALVLGLVAVSAAVALPGRPVQAADVTLRFAHFWPAVSGTHKTLYQVWADSVEEASGGRIAVEIYPSATLAKPPAQYDAVRTRIADMTATVQGYTANRFPLSQIVELPGVVDSGVQGSCILQTLFDEGLIATEYADTHPLFLFTHGSGHLHTAKTLVERPGDLAGLRIRRPTAVVATLLEGLGAQPVGLPAPETYTAMQRGVIDGAALPWEAMESFRLNELASYHTELGGLYTLAFVVTMNKQVYEGLPDDLREVIDAHSGLAWAKKAGAVFDALDVAGRKAAVEAGHTIVTVDGGARHPDWAPVLDAAVDTTLADLEARGLPAREVHGRAVALEEACAR